MTDAPNTDIHCNLCNKKITSCCMLSPNWSLLQQFNSAMLTMRNHFKEVHNMDKPSD